MTNNGTIIKISGPLVVAKGLSGTRIYDMVRIGRFKLPSVNGFKRVIYLGVLCASAVN